MVSKFKNFILYPLFKLEVLVIVGSHQKSSLRKIDNTLFLIDFFNQ
ncbi:MAG: hypothetical protein ACI9EK_002271, partial [Psychroserpens sp.]